MGSIQINHYLKKKIENIQDGHRQKSRFSEHDTNLNYTLDVLNPNVLYAKHGNASKFL